MAGKPSALRGPGFESGWTLGLGVLFSSVNFARRAKCCELAFKYFADTSVSLPFRAPTELASGLLALEPKWFRMCLIWFTCFVPFRALSWSTWTICTLCHARLACQQPLAVLPPPGQLDTEVRSTPVKQTANHLLQCHSHRGRRLQSWFAYPMYFRILVNVFDFIMHGICFAHLLIPSVTEH